MFRILSLDGGGIKGTLSESALVALEEATGKAVCRVLRPLTGTSIGGINVIGLGLGLTAREIV